MAGGKNLIEPGEHSHLWPSDWTWDDPRRDGVYRRFDAVMLKGGGYGVYSPDKDEVMMGGLPTIQDAEKIAQQFADIVPETSPGTFYAWVVREGDGSEGVIGALTALGNIQLATANVNVARTLFRPIAEKHHEQTGRAVRLVRYTAAETVEKFGRDDA